jgi:predicted RNase H-like HicB family nuclease
MKLTKKNRQYTAVVVWDPDSKLFVGEIEAIPGAHSQGRTLDELHENLREVLALCLEELTDEELTSLPQFVGVQQIEAAAK